MHITCIYPAIYFKLSLDCLEYLVQCRHYGNSCPCMVNLSFAFWNFLDFFSQIFLNCSWLKPWIWNSWIERVYYNCPMITLLAFVKRNYGVHASRKAEKLVSCLVDSEPHWFSLTIMRLLFWQIFQKIYVKILSTVPRKRLLTHVYFTSFGFS